MGASTLLTARPEAGGGPLRHGRGMTGSVGAQGAHTGSGRRQGGALSAGEARARALLRALCAGGGGEGEAGSAVLSRGR